MYEEHLWNFLHGKGFRSYLDRGLFLGEHVQVIHLLLIPFYVLWPSQMMLELCGSALFAAGCIPVYWISRRHTGDSRAATWLTAAYLLYAPLQYLDIGIDLKTFRPNGFGIPVLLFALDQLERCRYKTFCAVARCHALGGRRIMRSFFRRWVSGSPCDKPQVSVVLSLERLPICPPRNAECCYSAAPGGSFGLLSVRRYAGGNGLVS